MNVHSNPVEGVNLMCKAEHVRHHVYRYKQIAHNELLFSKWFFDGNVKFG